MFVPKFDLGETVKDTITSFNGYVTAITFSIDNEPVYLIEGKDAGRWFAEPRLQSSPVTEN